MAEPRQSAEAQIDAWAERWNQILDREQARFAAISQEVRPITVDDATVQRQFYEGLAEMREEREEREMYNDPGYEAYLREQVQQDKAISEAIDRREHPPWLDAVPTEAQQRAYEDAPYDRLEALAHGNEVHPDAQAMTSPETARLEALWEQLEALDAAHHPEQHQQQRDEGMEYEP
jgi:hypothetical protein